MSDCMIPVLRSAAPQLKRESEKDGFLADFISFFISRRLLAPNIKQREFLSEGAVQVSQQVRPKL